MRVLLVDTETTGILWDEGARVIEVAAALYDTKYAAVIESFSSLIRHDSNEAEAINGIAPGLLLEQGNEPERVWNQFLHLSEDAECYCAHRAEFDQGFVSKSIDALSFEVEPIEHILEMWDPAKPWCCSKTDFSWPHGLRGDSLVQLALGLGLGVASAHRAMVDVDTIARCLTRVHEMGFLLEEMFRRAMRPKVRVVAKVSFEQKDMAKAAGFLWDPEKREWYRSMCPDDVEGLPFRAVEKA